MRPCRPTSSLPCPIPTGATCSRSCAGERACAWIALSGQTDQHAEHPVQVDMSNVGSGASGDDTVGWLRRNAVVRTGRAPAIRPGSGTSEASPSSSQGRTACCQERAGSMIDPSPVTSPSAAGASAARTRTVSRGVPVEVSADPAPPAARRSATVFIASTSASVRFARSSGSNSLRRCARCERIGRSASLAPRSGRRAARSAKTVPSVFASTFQSGSPSVWAPRSNETTSSGRTTSALCGRCAHSIQSTGSFSGRATRSSRGPTAVSTSRERTCPPRIPCRIPATSWR